MPIARGAPSWTNCGRRDDRAGAELRDGFTVDEVVAADGMLTGIRGTPRKARRSLSMRAS